MNKETIEKIKEKIRKKHIGTDFWEGSFTESQLDWMLEDLIQEVFRKRGMEKECVHNSFMGKEGKEAICLDCGKLLSKKEQKNAMGRTPFEIPQSKEEILGNAVDEFFEKYPKSDWKGFTPESRFIILKAIDLDLASKNEEMVWNEVWSIIADWCIKNKIQLKDKKPIFDKEEILRNTLNEIIQEKESRDMVSLEDTTKKVIEAEKFWTEKYSEAVKNWQGACYVVEEKDRRIDELEDQIKTFRGGNEMNLVEYEKARNAERTDMKKKIVELGDANDRDKIYINTILAENRELSGRLARIGEIIDGKID